MSINAGEINARLKFDTSDFDRGKQRVEAGSKSMMTKFMELNQALELGIRAFDVTIGKALELGKHATQTAAEVEKLKISLDTITKGNGAATFEELNKWAMKMPMNTQEAIKAFISLRARGLEPTMKDMTVLVDATSALGGGSEKLQSIARALGDIQSKGRLAGQELIQLADQGVNAREAIAEYFGITVKEAAKRIEDGIDGSTALKALMQYFESHFGGQAEKIMGSWDGLMERMDEQYGQFEKKVMGSGVFESMKEGMADFVGYLESTEGQRDLEGWANDAADAIISMFETIVSGAKYAFMSFSGLEMLMNRVVRAGVVVKQSANEFQLRRAQEALQEAYWDSNGDTDTAEYRAASDEVLRLQAEIKLYEGILNEADKDLDKMVSDQDETLNKLDALRKRLDEARKARDKAKVIPGQFTAKGIGFSDEPTGPSEKQIEAAAKAAKKAAEEVAKLEEEIAQATDKRTLIGLSGLELKVAEVNVRFKEMLREHPRNEELVKKLRDIELENAKLIDQAEKQKKLREEAKDIEEQIAEVRFQDSLLGLKDYEKTLEQINFEYEKALKLHPELANELKQLKAAQTAKAKNQKNYDEAQKNKSWDQALRDGFLKTQEDAKSWAEVLEGVAQTASTSMGEAFSDGVFAVMENGFEGLEDVAGNFLKNLTKMFMDFAAQQVVMGIFGAIFGGVTGNISPSIMGNSGFGRHNGGIVDGSPGSFSRSINPFLFLGAPRFHTGLLPGEFPAILEEGETVIPKGGFRGNANISVNIKNESGESLKVSKVNTQGDLSQMVIDIVLDGYARNRSGMRDMFKS